MVKIYVAGKFQDKMEIHAKMQRLREMGHEITYDWTSFESEHGDVAKMRASAAADISGVADAELCVFLMTDPGYAYRGTFTELGAALALQKRCIVVCPEVGAYCATNCFFHHPEIRHVGHWDRVVEMLSQF